MKYKVIVALVGMPDDADELKVWDAFGDRVEGKRDAEGKLTPYGSVVSMTLRDSGTVTDVAMEHADPKTDAWHNEVQSIIRPDAGTLATSMRGLVRSVLQRTLRTTPQ